MANKIKKRFKQYTEDDIRKKKLKSESQARRNTKAKLDNAALNGNWDELYDDEASSHNR